MYIDSLEKYGYHYDWSTKSDKQIYCIWKKAAGMTICVGSIVRCSDSTNHGKVARLFVNNSGQVNYGVSFDNGSWSGNFNRSQLILVTIS
jgi:hypothetical protein